MGRIVTSMYALLALAISVVITVPLFLWAVSEQPMRGPR